MGAAIVRQAWRLEWRCAAGEDQFAGSVPSPRCPAEEPRTTFRAGPPDLTNPLAHDHPRPSRSWLLPAGPTGPPAALNDVMTFSTGYIAGSP